MLKQSIDNFCAFLTFALYTGAMMSAYNTIIKQANGSNSNTNGVVCGNAVFIFHQRFLLPLPAHVVVYKQYL